MMVVVVIILVLASLMFVGFSHAQRTADAVYCMNNLDKIGKVILNYAVLYFPNRAQTSYCRLAWRLLFSSAG